jgi:superfamily II DNA helicase RecQ
MSLTSPWRADFPGMLALEAEGQTYLDSAATAQKPQAVLDALLGYCEAAECRRYVLLRYLGESVTGDGCGNCDVCRQPVQRWDATMAQKALAAVQRHLITALVAAGVAVIAHQPGLLAGGLLPRLR